MRGPPYPVFCEKRTDIVDGQYITTRWVHVEGPLPWLVEDKKLNVNDCLRGCSQETWEDIKGYQV